MLLACLLATLAFAPQDPTISERLDALTAKSNEYEHFVATYHFEGKSGDAGELRILYRAPDQAKFEVIGDKYHYCLCMDGDTTEIRSESGDGTASTATVDSGSILRSESEWLQHALEAAFPKMVPAAELEMPEGLSFGSDGGEDCESYGLELSKGGRARLVWLFQMRRQLDRVSMSDAAAPGIVFRPCEDLRVTVSPDSGFITRMERDRKGGVQVGLSLISLELGQRPTEDDLRPTATASEARDVSDAYRSEASRTAFAWGRSGLYRVIANSVKEGKLEWNDEARTKLVEVMRRVHESDLPPLFGSFLAKEKRWIEETAKWARSYLAGFDQGDEEARAQLSPTVAKSRTDLEGQCSIIAEKLIEFVFPGDSSKPPSGLMEELAAIERRVLAEVFAERITKSLLAEFDEKVGKQLEPK